MRDPGLEHWPWLAVEEDGESEKDALGDEEADLTGEGDPGQVIEKLDQRRVSLRAESGNQPEQVRYAKQRRSAGHAPQEAEGEDRRAMRHPADLHHDQHKERDQRDPEPVEHDHAVADAREIVRVAIKGGNLLGRHRRRHWMHEPGKCEEAQYPDEPDDGYGPEYEELAICAFHRSPCHADAGLDTA